MSSLKSITRLKSLREKLKTFLSRDQILDDPSDLVLYETDATSMFKNRPGLVLIPFNTDEISKILRAINEVNQLDLLNQPKISFLARGAGTGLSGGAIGGSDTVVISLARMNRLIEFNPINRTALIETGLVNSELTRLIQKHHNANLHFAPDPSSQDACTIGGNIAENAGGIHCFKHGVTADQILGLEVVMPNGDIQELGAIKDGVRHSLIDFSRLFTGTEGTFGIATKALVRLSPVPESFLTMQVCFSDIDHAARTVSEIIARGFKPTAIEMIDEGAIQAVSQAYELGLVPDTKAVLLIELDGDNDEVLLESAQIKELIHNPSLDLNPIQYEETQDPERRKFLWKVRKGTVSAFGKLAPFWYLYDVVVPRSKIPEAVKFISEVSSKHALRLASVFHAADGNLHPNFLYDPEQDPSVITRIHKASAEILKFCIEIGGTLSGEHGIGVEKQDHMPYLFSQADMLAMLKIRKIFDPDMISNPNKIFPVRVCKEC
jgi:glycolate oxidase subunit GlcD